MSSEEDGDDSHLDLETLRLKLKIANRKRRLIQQELRELQASSKRLNQGAPEETTHQSTWSKPEVVSEYQEIQKADHELEEGEIAHPSPTPEPPPHMYFDEASGQYYDTTSGMYYDPSTTLYYQSETGSYFKFVHMTNQFQLHSYSAMYADVIAAAYQPVSSALFTVGVEGAVVGRETHKLCHAIEIPEPDLSRRHFEVLFNPEIEGGRFCIRDTDSANGTTLNGIKLLHSGEESDAQVLSDGDLIKAGKATTLVVHLHDAAATCGDCAVVEAKPKLVKPSEGASSKLDLAAARREETNRIKKLYKIGTGARDQAPTAPTTTTPASTLTDESISTTTTPTTTTTTKPILYVGIGTEMRCILSIDPRDRAAVRRVVVGSDAPDLPVRTEMASQDKPIPSSNIGKSMLKAMGWTEGTGLGKSNSGIIQPIKTEVRTDQSGVGSATAHMDKTAAIAAKTKARYTAAQIVASDH